MLPACSGCLRLTLIVLRQHAAADAVARAQFGEGVPALRGVVGYTAHHRIGKPPASLARANIASPASRANTLMIRFKWGCSAFSSRITQRQQTAIQRLCNIWELSNAVEHGVICSDAGNVDVDSLPLDIRLYSQESGLQPYEQQVPSHDSEPRGDDSEDARKELLTALNKVHGSKAVAAQILGIDRTTLWRRMQKFEIAG